MKKYLTIGEAAKRLNLQVDTVRRLERDGILKAERTEGKHRRFLTIVIERYAEAREAVPARARCKVAPPARSVSRPPVISNRGPTPTPSVRSRPHRERILAEPFPDEEAWESVEDSPSLQPTAWKDPVVAPPPPQPPTITPDRTREEEANRLQTIKNLGLQAIPFTIPAAWRGRVVADLERFVTRSQFPKYLSSFEAGNIVRARVEEVLEPYHAELARQNQEREEKVAAESKLSTLKAHGRNYAVRETSDWKWSDASGARKEVERALDDEVAGDWSERDVEDLADDILDEFDEDDETEADEEGNDNGDDDGYEDADDGEDEEEGDEHTS